MKKTTLIFVLGIFLTSSFAFADSKVKNIDLYNEDGYTVAQIDVSGPVKFSHQTEIAKDGRPFRIIVDLLTATHNLGLKEFAELPACAVQNFRSSQYSVKPEKVVRVVLDMTKETVYRMESNDNFVKILIPDNSVKPFARWSSAKVVAAKAKSAKATLAAKPEVPKSEPAPNRKVGSKKTSSELNKEFDKDRLASLEGTAKTKATKTESKPAVKKSKSKTTKSADTPAKTKPAKVEKSSKKRVVEPLPKPKGQTASKPAKVDPWKPTQLTGTQRQFTDTDWFADVPAPAPKKKAKPAVKKQQPKAQPKKAKPVVAQKDAAPKPKAKQEPAAKKQVVAKPAPKKEKPSSYKVAASERTENFGPVIPKGFKAPKKASKPKEQPKKKAESKSKQLAAKTETPKVKAPDKKAAKPVTKAAPKKTKEPVKKEKPVVVAKADKPAEEKSSTSRFRRNPKMSKKMRGTMVAEFPKRLVIKYKATGYRDPFATLIDESRVLSSPIAQRVPNVEGLKLVGVIESPNGSRALFEDVDGYGYFLTTGDRVQKGYVLRIEADRVYFQIFEYGWSRTVALSIDAN